MEIDVAESAVQNGYFCALTQLNVCSDSHQGKSNMA